MRHGDTLASLAAFPLMASHPHRRAVVAIAVYLAGLTACAASHPTVQTVTTQGARILISADVGDAVRICVQPTAPMLAAEPTTDTAICRFTVGDVRYLTTLRRPAN